MKANVSGLSLSLSTPFHLIKWCKSLTSSSGTDLQISGDECVGRKSLQFLQYEQSKFIGRKKQQQRIQGAEIHGILNYAVSSPLTNLKYGKIVLFSC